MRTLNISSILVTTLLGLIVLAGCKGRQNAPETLAGPAMLEGTLRAGTMAIGGETTGFQLERRGDSAVDVDMRKVSNGDQYDGQRVRLLGRFEPRNYTERGRVNVYVVEEVMRIR